MIGRSESSELERLERIEAHIAIADLVHGYARLVRQDRPEDVSALFLPDGTFEVRDGHPDRPDFTVRERLESADAIRTYLLPGKGKRHPIPLIFNLMIEVDGDTATANSVMRAPIFGTSHEVFGEYRDTFRREDGRWLFASRTYTLFAAGSSV